MIQLIVHQMVNQRSCVLLILSYVHTVDNGGVGGRRGGGGGGVGANRVICGRMCDHEERGSPYLMLR